MKGIVPPADWYHLTPRLYGETELSCRGLLGDDFQRVWKELERRDKPAKKPTITSWDICVRTMATSQETVSAQNEASSHSNTIAPGRPARTARTKKTPRVLV